MAFDQITRNGLQRLVGDARKLLTGEFVRQMQNEYGMDPVTGSVSAVEVLHLDDSRLETARILRNTLDHYRTASAEADDKMLLEQIAREQAFTVLNRFAALKMAEARGIVIESIGNGYESRAFQLYQNVAGAGLGDTGETFKAFLFSIFDEFAVDLKVLFDRFSPTGLLFPKETVMLELLAIVNDPEINPLWAEDETIGWIYQYFNTKEERKKMRDESAAPRNSRELAVRNQFFTPRYVVEFLTDNTLGRTWYEMTKGETSLAESCCYLVRRPNEVFLDQGQDTPEAQSDGSENLSQEDLLKQTVYIPHRPLKDPREILLLDPACGSMHFGLYAFDLFLNIYEEAWELSIQPSSASGLKPLHETYKNDKERFFIDIPRLIIENNIHGVDIDSRAVQIAGLSLWLRAQRAWAEQNVKAADRPQIRRSNIVCAEPMPGEADLLEEFIAKHFADTAEKRLLGEFVRRIFESMKLAGEAGSLLKIEEEVADLISESREQWRKLQGDKRSFLFEGARVNIQADLDFEVGGITDVNFWDKAENEIYEALHRYSDSGDGGVAYRRRLFADDAAQGFAFIDIRNKNYDVVVMNPPFGEPSLMSRKYLASEYPSHKTELLACFVSMGLFALAPQGLMGVISSRTMLVNATCEDLRFEIGKNYGCLRVFADLGYGVLDGAMVEAAAYICEQVKDTNADSIFISLLKDENKDAALLDAIEPLLNSGMSERITIRILARFATLFRFPWAYWLPDTLLASFLKFEHIEKSFARVRVGSSTADNFRFLRLSWEVQRSTLGASRVDTWNSRYWIALAKGGEYWPFYDDLHLTINWAKGGLEIAQSAGSTIRSPDDYFLGGCTYPYRTTSAFALRALPDGAIFSDGGPAIIPQSGSQRDRWMLLCYCNTRIARYFLEVFLGEGDAVVSGSAARNYIPRAVGAIPIPDLSGLPFPDETVHDWYRSAILPSLADETTRTFVSIADSLDGTIAQIAERVNSKRLDRINAALEASYFCEQEIAERLGLATEAMIAIGESSGWHPCEYPSAIVDEHEISRLYGLSIDSLVDEVAATLGGGRYITKKSFYADRRIELICHAVHCHPSEIIRVVRKLGLSEPGDYSELSTRLISWIFGSVFGRWDIRYSLDVQPPWEIPDPFSPLPSCAPGMLQNLEGLPPEPAETATDYPLEIAWSGILVDDPGDPYDIENRLHGVLRAIWKESAEVIESEACGKLSVHSLRDYFRKPSGFFADHLKRYSKSRRQAPIYLPLSTKTGEYTLWLYYHRLTDQTLFSCINDFVEPKIRQVKDDVNGLSSKPGRSSDEEKRLEQLTDLSFELEELRDELLRLAPIWKPNLNDGVQITMAPLWKLFRLPKWRKTLEDILKKLEKGEYDWAHLAYSLYPDRVREKCKRDKSLAIAHGLDDLYVEPPATKKKKKKTTDAEEPELDLG